MTTTPVSLLESAVPPAGTAVAGPVTRREGNDRADIPRLAPPSQRSEQGRGSTGGFAQHLRWELTHRLWNGLVALKFRANRPRGVPTPAGSARKIRRIPLAERYPAIPISNIFVADHVPRDEKLTAALALCRFQAALYRHVPPKVAGLPAIDADPAVALDRALPRSYRKQLRAPEFPEEYRDPVDLGRLAVSGPYFAYLRRRHGHFEWDLTDLGRYERHMGLRSLGVRVSFAVDECRRRLVPVAIDCELGRCTPSDEQWDLAQRIALCAVTTHLSLVRHFNGIHLALVAQFAIATRNVLPANHGLRRLLWPHVWGTQYSNELVTEVLMMPGGDFEEIFSFTHAGLCELFADTHDQFDIRVIDPCYDASDRDVRDHRIDYPGLDNHLALWHVIHAHTRRSLAVHYDSDAAIAADPHVRAWIAELDALVPGGVRRLSGDRITLPGVARLIAGFIHASTVQHEAYGSKLWDYQLWTAVQPVRVYRDGRREPLDLYQRLVNYNFMLNVRRAPLMQDLSYLADSDDAGVAFRTFFAELAQLDTTLTEQPAACWKICPADLEVGANG